jgi:DNA-binding response OmpR family regulator
MTEQRRGDMKRLLIVEDDLDLRDSLAILLSHDYQLRTAADGKCAVDIVEHGFHPDVILLDYQIPAPSGRELIQALKDLGENIPVLLMSACGDVRQLARDIGVKDSICKPFNLGLLREKLARLQAAVH